jgi:tight adherence protein B
MHMSVSKRFERFESLLERAGMQRRTEDSVMTWLIMTAGSWIVILLLLRPVLWLGLLILPVCGVLAALVYSAWVHWRLRVRIEAFVQQLELALRLMASGLRTGLGLRQSLALVTEELEDPARYEYARVIGQANIGVSLHDALDDLAERLPQNETMMMARVIRIQSTTGGDLAKVLEQLANTIKERRRMRRKVQALTAEGRAGALVLAALPIFLGSFIVLTQPDLGHGLLFTQAGHYALMIVTVLETLGVFTLNRILKVNV